MKVLILIILLFNFNCIKFNRIQSSDYSSTQFNDFIACFHRVDVPFSLDRKDVFDCSRYFYDTLTHNYRSDMYPVVGEQFKQFIPNDILEENHLSCIRCLYVFPEYNEETRVLIAKDFMENGEQRELKIFLINFVGDGKIQSFIEVAGYGIDLWEAFLSVDNNFIVTRVKYRFIENNDFQHDDLFFLSETINVCEITNTGYFECNDLTSRNGYFKGVLEGYLFVTD